VLIGKYKRFEEECYLYLQGYELPNYKISHLKHTNNLLNNLNTFYLTFCDFVHDQDGNFSRSTSGVLTRRYFAGCTGSLTDRYM